MLQQLTAKQSRVSALVLLLITMFSVLWLFIVPQWADKKMYESEVGNLRFKLAKYEQAIKREPQLKKEHEGVLQILETAQLFYTGMAPGVAAAKVQTTIREAVKKSKGNLISTQILAEKKNGDFTKISISLRLKAGDRALQALLYELETSRPLLKIEKVVISSNRRPNKRRMEPLNITLEISSYLAQKEAR